MSNALVQKLQAFGPLPEDDQTLISKLTRTITTVESGRDIISEGDKPSDVNLVLAGFAFRYKLMPKGSRQIVAYLLPGDFCDLHIFLLGFMDHNIAALTEAQIVRLSRGEIDTLLDRPAISRAMLMATLVDEAVMREWLANNGQRSAEARIAHFLCEWHRRLQTVGLVEGSGCDLPITQAELGDTMGLSTVHVNRSIQTLRDKGLVKIGKRNLFVPDLRALYAAYDFDPRYLHLEEAVDARAR